MVDGVDDMAISNARLLQLNLRERQREQTNIRPKDASTLLIFDRAGSGPFRVLMGRRHSRHAFYPGAYVFPGGRVDPTDSRVKPDDDYHPAVAAKLSHALRGPKSAARVRAFGIAALRETYEEAGLLIGRRADDNSPALRGQFAAFGERSLTPSLAVLRFVARAITPPRIHRRFDTRFFACFASDIADRLPEGVGPSGELENISWLTFDEAERTMIPPITIAILEEISAQLARDPMLAFDAPTPFYRWLGQGFKRDLI